ncbi:MAG: hypothetical protein JKY09_03485 [Crocinitomicaceae bacterium]|nr:hypothetical protein [Crocinitomicaceae bacterium]
MSEENVALQPQGKGLAVGGFVLSLVGLIFAPIMVGINFASMAAAVATGEKGGTGLMIFWVVFCVFSVLLSIMGMTKLGKTGGKKGLAIAGMIIGIVATIWSVFLLMGLGIVEASTALDNMDPELIDALRSY